MNITKTLSITLLAGMFATPIAAQQERDNNLVKSDRNGWEYEVRAGVNIGGASPLPLPREIRSIEHYSPKLNGVVEANVTKWLGTQRRWGFTTGLKVEEKGMKTGANVKNYHTSIVNDGQSVEGYYTGYVETDYNTTLLTVPLMASYKAGNRWKLRMGISASWKLDGTFTGFVSNGYLREGNPTGQKVSFEGEDKAAFDFSDELRPLQWNARLGASWQAYKHFSVNADFLFGLNDIFRQHFHTISFAMYPIYLNAGFGYRF